jgi:hypothetical protein
MDRSDLFKTVVIAGICLHANHEPQVPAWRRREHVPENQPVQAVDIGATMIMAAMTTSGSIGGGAVVGGEASGAHYRGNQIL